MPVDVEEFLPEELIHEVLRHAIVPFTDTFLDPAHSREFFHSAHDGQSGSVLHKPSSPLGSHHLLLVCKRWLRIGAPLLYTALWLSTPAHAACVARVFADNPALGAAVRDLRLDGGFDAALAGVLSRAPNVQHLHLGYALQRGDEIDGLLAALPSMRLRRLYLGPMSGLNVREAERAVDMLLDQCIAETWTSLVRAYTWLLCAAGLAEQVDSYSQEYIHLHYWCPVTRPRAQALQAAPALRELSLHSQDVYNLTWGVDLLCFLHNATLQKVWCRSHLNLAKTRADTLESGVSKWVVDKLTFVWHDCELWL
jgi:hypothetical protein